MKGLFTLFLFLHIKFCFSQNVLTFEINQSDLQRQLSDGQCIWYGECERTYSGMLNCVYNGPSKPLKDTDARKILQKYCPYIAKGDQPLTCCDTKQLHTMKGRVGLIEQFLQRCPSCFENFMKLFCEMTCSPYQSKFLNAKSVDGTSVTSLDYYISPTYVNGMFNSCFNVTMPSMIGKALSIFCGRPASECNGKALLDYMGSTDNGHTPFQINFTIMNQNVTIKDKIFLPMNDSTAPCTQSCKCQDCPQVCRPSPKPLLCPNATCFDGKIRSIFRQEQLLITRPRNRTTFQHKLPPPSDDIINFTSLFDRQFLHMLLTLQESIFNLTAKFEGEDVTLEDICFRPRVAGSDACGSVSILEYWQSNKTAVDLVKKDEYGFFIIADYLDHFLYCSKYLFIDYDKGVDFDPALNMSCRSTSNEVIHPYNVLAGYGEENFNSSIAFVMTYLVNNYQDDRRNAMARAWESEFLHFIENYSSPNMTVKALSQV